jgi:hypothetical protein
VHEQDFNSDLQITKKRCYPLRQLGTSDHQFIIIWLEVYVAVRHSGVVYAIRGVRCIAALQLLQSGQTHSKSSSTVVLIVYLSPLPPPPGALARLYFSSSAEPKLFVTFSSKVADLCILVN